MLKQLKNWWLRHCVIRDLVRCGLPKKQVTLVIDEIMERRNRQN